MGLRINKSVSNTIPPYFHSQAIPSNLSDKSSINYFLTADMIAEKTFVRNADTRKTKTKLIKKNLECKIKKLLFAQFFVI